MPPIAIAVIERTARACGRLDAVATRSAVVEGWRQRGAIDAAVALAASEGHGLDREALVLALLGAPPDRRTDPGGVQAGLRWLQVLLPIGGSTSEATDNRTAGFDAFRNASDVVEVEADQFFGQSLDNQILRIGPLSVDLALSGPDLTKAIAVVFDALETDCTGAGSVLAALPDAIATAVAGGVSDTAALAAVPAVLVRVRFLARAWPGLVVVPRLPLTAPGWGEALLGDLATAAERELGLLDRLERAWSGWHRALGPLRSRSRLPQVLDLAVGVPAVTPVWVARRLARAGRSCTVPGASHLLRQLVAMGVLTEVSGRRSWQLYMPADLAPAPRPQGAGPVGATAIGPDGIGFVMPAPLLLSPIAPIAEDWTALLADADAAIRRSNGVLRGQREK